ncbi:MAG TPA: chitobiase/beta-hexosaminidase C-terminal domain-containing protein, partial [Myxococcaceae bacterium]
MTLKSAGILRFLLALVFLQLASACGGGDNPPPQPPPEDTTAPTTRADPAGGPVTAPLTVTLTCEDRGSSGCAATHYTTDGSTPTQSSPTYSAPLAIAATTTLKFFSVDAKGNVEEVKTETYTFSTGTDTTPPTVSASPAGGTYSAAQTVTLTCNDGTGVGCASIRYTTDGSTPTAASAQYSAPLAVSANTTLKFFATDAAGNASAVVTETYVITIVTDTTPPTVAASPAGGLYNAPQSVTLTCGDGTGSGCASIRYTTDGSTPTAASAQYTGPLSISANTALKFIGIDNAGNVSAVRTENYVLDTTAPTVAANPAGGTYTSARTVSLTCTDATGCASIRYTTDGSTPTATSPQYTGPLSISANTTLKFIGIDNAGNVSAVRTETYVIVIVTDTTPPTVTANPASGTYTSAQSVTLTCNDGTGSG